MKVTAENIDNQQVVLEIEVSADEWGKAIQQAVTKVANQVNIPGFRKGKAPRRILEQHVGQKALLDEAYEIAAPKAFDAALKEQKIELAAYPKFETVTAEDGKPLVFKATVTPKPEVQLGEYKGLKIAKKPAEVSEEEVDKHIEQMRDRQAQMVEAPADAVVADGDFTTLDFKGFVDGEAFDGGEGKDYPLQIGSKSFIPGFEDQLIGAKIGEEREVKVAFPEDYHEKKLAGKPAVFKCTVRTIKHKELPALDDAFAAKVSVFKTLAELKQDVRAKMEKTAATKAENDRRAEAIQQAADNITVTVPPVMVDDRVTQMIQELSMRLEQQGLKFEQYLQYSGTDIAKIREDYRENAEKNVRTDLMLEAVAKAEGVKVEAADLDSEIAMMAQAYGATVEQVRKIIQEQGRIGDLAVTVLRRKTAQLIVDSLTE
jgi:trigger factor